MSHHGKRKRRRGAPADRAGEARTLGGLPLWVVARQGMLHPNTGSEAGPRVRASPAERAPRTRNAG
jgi:hypothetical protein